MINDFMGAIPYGMIIGFACWGSGIVIHKFAALLSAAADV